MGMGQSCDLRAKASGCLNWEWPDKYGHYRVAKYTQIKHHWWWKVPAPLSAQRSLTEFQMNYVFEGIRELKGYSGFLLLLEEDHFVSPDALHVFNYIIQHKQQ